MKRYFLYAVLLIFYNGGTIAYASDEMDLDVDGVPDVLSVSRSQKSDDEVVIDLRINYSSKAPSVQMSKTIASEEASYFAFYQWQNAPGTLVLDYTNRGTRQPTDFYYEIYRWVGNLNKLCLHSTSSGISPDQLAGETYDSARFVRLYSDCIGLGEGIPARNITDDEYYQKSSAFAYISANKARLYNSPNDKDKTKMYLIKGDKVKVKKYKYTAGRNWYFVEYQPEGKGQPITKWLRGESVDPNVR